MHIKASTVLSAIAALPLAAYAQSSTTTSKSSSSSSSKDACASIGSMAESVTSSSGLLLPVLSFHSGQILGIGEYPRKTPLF